MTSEQFGSVVFDDTSLARIFVRRLFFSAPEEEERLESMQNCLTMEN